MTRRVLDDLKGFIHDLEVEPVADEGTIRQVRKYRLITPLFGGGAKTKKADPVKIIRETAIRGQLRFWWRAIRGVGTIAEMAEKEAVLFGTAGTKRNGNSSGQSKIKVVVTVINEGRGITKNSQDVPKYAVFPLEDDDVLRQRVEFLLDITFPRSFDGDIEAALWAWETFGGVGGRTRRGFGAVQLLAINNVEVEAPKCDEVQSYIESKIKLHLRSGDWTAGVPHLSNDVNNVAYSAPSMLPNHDNSKSVWLNIVDKLQRFRQSPRNSTAYSGESHWPEPDAIRRITGQHAKSSPVDRRAKDRAPSHLVGNKFPRGQLGLPIIFKFKNSDVNSGDPGPQTLQGREYERLSSPLILRPVACSDGAVGIALALDTPREPLGGVVLRAHPGTVETLLSPDDIANIRPMNSASTTETDVVKSFLKTV